MKIIKPSYEIVTPISKGGEEELKTIEAAARVCYKSEAKAVADVWSERKFVRSLIQRGHESPLEHEYLTVKFVCDRAIANELTRHRIASFNQESTRYCNYSKDDFGTAITVIQPHYLAAGTEPYTVWMVSCVAAENAYFSLLEAGLQPQEARAVLPLCTKTELYMTANYREWRHILKLRTDKAAHPQMRQLMVPLLHDLKEKLPIIFDDIGGAES